MLLSAFESSSFSLSSSLTIALKSSGVSASFSSGAPACRSSCAVSRSTSSRWLVTSSHAASCILLSASFSSLIRIVCWIFCLWF